MFTQTLTFNIWEIVAWGLLWFSSSNEMLKNIPTKERRIAEFHWILKPKPQNHPQVSQKALWKKGGGEKKQTTAPPFPWTWAEFQICNETQN